jgi:serpin B
MKRNLLTLFTALTIFPCLAQDDLVAANNDFSIRLFKSLKTDSADFFISPFGLHIALSIVNEGARSDTRSEIDQLLGLKIVGDRAIKYVSLIDSTINTEDGQYNRCALWSGDQGVKNELIVANSLWINGDMQIDSDFEATVEKRYRAEVFQVAGRGGGKEINKWVTRATNNRISQLPPLDPEARLTVVDVVHFNGVWDLRFKEKKTKARKFNNIKHEKVLIDFMRHQAHYRYFEDEQIQAIQLPYKCDQFSMVVILPRQRYGILEIEEKLTPAYVERIMKGSVRSEVILSLPKFSIESEIFPKEEFEKMGYGMMFSDGADFSGISSTNSLKVGRILHKTFISVDEKQTEATAASLVEMVVVGYGGGEPPPPPPPPKVFDADHPFIFLIVDHRTEAILFMGRLASPVSIK